MEQKRKEVIGSATLYLGNCMEIIGELSQVGLCVADPPYSSGGLMRGDRMGNSLSKYVNGEYRASFSGDNRDQRSFTLWQSFWMERLFRVMEEGAYLFCFTDWRQLAATCDAVQVAGFVLRGIIPWNKGEQVRPQRGYFRNQCEYVVWGSRGAVSGGAIRSGFLQCPAPCGNERVHPVQKPVEIFEYLFSIREGGLVLDPFMGSGSAGVAAVRQGRNFVGIEQDRHWFEVACQRIEAARHESSLLELL